MACSGFRRWLGAPENRQSSPQSRNQHPQVTAKALRQELQVVQEEVTALRKQIHKIASQPNMRPAANLRITPHAGINTTFPVNSQWTHDTSVWTTMSKTPPPPYSDTEHVPGGSTPPLGCDSRSIQDTRGRNSASSPAHARSTQSIPGLMSDNAQRRITPKFARSVSDVFACYPDSHDYTSNYYFTSSQTPVVEEPASTHITDRNDRTKRTKQISAECPSYVNVEVEKPNRKKSDFSLSIHETSAARRNDESILECVRQLEFDVITDATDEDGALIDNEEASDRSRLTDETFNRPRPRPSANKRRLSINSDITDFFKTSMNRPAVTHKINPDRFKSISKQMKQIRRKLRKHGSMADVNMDTLAVL